MSHKIHTSVSMPDLPYKKREVRQLLELALADSSTITVPPERIEKAGGLRKAKLAPINRHASEESALTDNTFMREDATYLTSTSFLTASEMDDSLYSSPRSLHSVTSIASREVSVKAKIDNIEKRMRKKKHLSNQSILAALPPEHYSWNKKTKRRSVGKRPKINILGCHQAEQLIIAKADERIRRQLHAIEKKEKHCRDLRDHVNNLIQSKLKRGERFALLMQQQQQQTFWLKLFPMILYPKLIVPLFNNLKKEKVVVETREEAAATITHSISSWYEHRVLMRYIRFITHIADVKWLLSIKMRVFQKRRATKIIRTFLYEVRDRQEISKMVHRFLESVRRVQRMVKGYLRCKKARIETMLIKWDRLERQYIKNYLNKRKDSVKQASSQAMQDLAVDPKTRLEMDRQNKKWEMTNARMEEILEEYRQSGFLTNEAENESLDKLMLPYDRKIELIVKIINDKRKAHVMMVQSMQSRYNEHQKFSMDDANALLKGGEISPLKVAAVPSSTVVRNLIPFTLLKRIDVDILETIRAEHNRQQTFVVKGQTVALLRMQSMQKKSMSRQNSLERSSSKVMDTSRSTIQRMNSLKPLNRLASL